MHPPSLASLGWAGCIISLALWICLKQGSAHMVLVVLLQMGTKDLTVCSAEYEYLFSAVQSRQLIAVLTLIVY